MLSARPPPPWHTGATAQLASDQCAQDYRARTSAPLACLEPAPCRDTPSQFAALCGAIRYIADALAYFAQFTLTEDSLRTFDDMLYLAIHLTLAIRNAAAEASAAMTTAGATPYSLQPHPHPPHSADGCSLSP